MQNNERVASERLGCCKNNAKNLHTCNFFNKKNCYIPKVH